MNDEQRSRPDVIARVVASAIVSTVAGAVAGKFFGRKAFFVGFLIGAAAHELLDAPLAQRLSDLGL